MYFGCARQYVCQSYVGLDHLVIDEYSLYFAQGQALIQGVTKWVIKL